VFAILQVLYVIQYWLVIKRSFSTFPPTLSYLTRMWVTYLDHPHQYLVWMIVHYQKHGTLARLRHCHQALLMGLLDPSSVIITIRDLAHLNAQLSQKTSFLFLTFFLSNLFDMILTLFFLSRGISFAGVFTDLIYLL